MLAASVFAPRNSLPCVGLVVLGGCLTILVAPDSFLTPAPNEPPVTAQDALPVIVIDAGHGGNDGGARQNGHLEKYLTLDLAFRLQKLLKQSGLRTAMTRSSDVYVSLEERVRLAHKHRDAVFVSLHFNSDRTPGTAGIETFYSSRKVPLDDDDWTWVGLFKKDALQPQAPLDSGEMLAASIQAALTTRTDSRNRGVRARDYFVVRHTRCPAVLVEGGFLTNSFEAQLIATDGYRERLAQGLTEGILEYLQTRPAPALPAPQPPRLAQTR